VSTDLGERSSGGDMAQKNDGDNPKIESKYIITTLK